MALVIAMVFLVRISRTKATKMQIDPSDCFRIKAL